MKKIIRLTESDLVKIVKRVIREFEDPEFLRGADDNWKRIHGDDDEDFDEDDTDFYNEVEYYDLLDQAKEFLISLDMDEDEVFDMSDDEVIEAIKNYDDDLYEKLNDMKYSEPIDKDEPYDSIGGHSINDLERAFKNLKK